MNLSHYSKKLYPNLSGINNQGHFIGALFHAAGSKFFPERPEYGTDSYQRKLFSGSKPLTQDMKDSFPKPLEHEKLTSFFQMRIGETSFPKMMDNFGVPKDAVQNKGLFITALCTQFQSIISDAANDIDDIVASEYIQLLRQIDCNAENLFPLYPGDDYLLVSESLSPKHVVGFYEIFEHTWSVKNTGTVTWENRRFEWVNQSAPKIKALDARIEFSVVKPGEAISFTARFDSRGVEGTFESMWELIDAGGRICFPDDSKALKMVVTVENRIITPSEV